MGSLSVVSGFELADRNCEYSFEVGTFCCILFLLLLYLFSVLISRVKSISTDFYSLFYCCFVTPLSQVRGGLRLTNRLNPATYCVPVPSQEPVVQWMSLFACLLLFVLRCLNRLGRLLYFMNIDTFCIFRGLLQLALRYGSRSIVEGRYVTCRSLNFVCFWCMAVSLTIIPHLPFSYA